MTINRRDFLIDLSRHACAMCMPALVWHPGRPPQEQPAGCALSLNSNQTAALRGRSTSRSGNDALDRALIAEVRKLDRVFGINPGYRFMYETGGPNAMATGETLVGGTRGTILFGLTLVSRELNTAYGGAALAGIAGHEGAHIYQFANGYQSRLRGRTVKPMELHADFLAGWYFARTGRTEPSLVAFGTSLFDKGDYQYNDRDHHGTPEERVSAMQAGYAVGNITNVSTAAERGAQYVS